MCYNHAVRNQTKVYFMDSNSNEVLAPDVMNIHDSDFSC